MRSVHDEHETPGPGISESAWYGKLLVTIPKKPLDATAQQAGDLHGSVLYRQRHRNSASGEVTLLRTPALAGMTESTRWRISQAFLKYLAGSMLLLAQTALQQNYVDRPYATGAR
jgi:hypothetical protein